MEINKKDKERFENKYNKYSNNCWVWTGGLCNGYGEFRYKEKKAFAHRFSWMLYRGEIPEGMNVLHKCNHRWCVNPEHLYIGTQSDNICDAVKAGKRPGAKLAKDDVVCIKKMLRDRIPRWLIAWIYEVSQPTLSNIKSGLTWSDVTM